MAYIPGYEYDIFISYVHDDNESEIKGHEGWVDKFHRYLNVKLTKHDKKIKIWWDSRNLDKADMFDDAIKDAIEKSALMICLIGRRYNKSDYCLKELDWFKKKSEKENVDLSFKSRVLPVLLSNIPFKEWPHQGTSGFQFHDGKTEEDYGDALNEDQEGKEYGLRMKELRNSIVKLFNEFLKEEESVNSAKIQSENITAENENSFTVFVGAVTDALEDRRDGIISKLKSEGYNVISNDIIPESIENYREGISKMLDQSDLAIHLLDEFPGNKINGDATLRCIQKEVEFSMESEVPQIIWLSDETDIEAVKNELHRNFLGQIEKATLSDKGYEFLRVNEGEIYINVTDYIGRLEELKTEDSEEVEEGGNNSIKVLLDTHIDDFKQAFKLKKLLSKNNIDLIFNPEDGDPIENLNSIYKYIKESKKFIFLYGNKHNKQWVDIRVNNTLKKLQDFSRFSQDIFIYMTPPLKQPDTIAISGHPLVKVLNHSDVDEIDENFVKELVQQLKDES